jgi:TPR repeat protein
LQNRAQPGHNTISRCCTKKASGFAAKKTQATEWLERAARSGSVIARDRISSREAEVVLKTAKERARLGNAEAMMVIANIYADGVSVTRNLDEAHL